MEDRPPVFFSYAREDGDFVLRLARGLRTAGVDLWLDQLDIKPGDKWDQAVEQALEICECLVVVLSQAAVASSNVMDEVSFALEQGKQVVPVLKEGCKIPFRLRRLQHIDFTGVYDAGFAKLADALGGAQASPADASVQPPPPARVPSQEMGAPARVTETKPPTAASPRARGLLWGGVGLAASLAVAAWLVFYGPGLGRDVVVGKLDPTNWDPTTTPAYVVVDSAWKTKTEARTRVAELNPTYGNSGFIWIPEFDSLSGAQLFQVYVGPFRTRTEAERATCDYIAKFQKKKNEHYAVLVSTQTTNQDRLFCGDL